MFIGGTRDFRTEADQLRAQRMELQREVDQLSDKLAQARGQIEALQAQLRRADQNIDHADPPVLSRLLFARFTGGIDTTGDNRHDTIRIYLHTHDQHGRMIPVTGQATLRAVHIPDENDPRVIAQRTYGPEQLNRAYRSGITGTHYTFELPLPDDLPEDATELTLRVRLTDAVTGAKLTAQQPVTIQRKPREPNAEPRP